MAIDQGKTSLRNSLDQLARQSGQSLEDLKPPTFRPPYIPLPLAAAAGPNVGRWYRPERRLPCHDEHVALQARFDEFGGWRRPLYYARSSAARECIEREARAVRNAAGLFDASPLGKLEVSGPDALEFLDRLYVNNLRSLKVGQVRYVLMLRDNGVVMDDGTVARLGPEEFWVTTTSGNAERVYLWMREWSECEWPRLKVLITPVTPAWGTVTLSGPKARSILTRVGTDIDLGPGAFPHMTFREGVLANISARICRVSFTGEVSYEINVRVTETPALWQALQEGGTAEGVTAHGVEALNVLRTEKGYLHIGADTDATTTPLDLGWESVIERKRGDFIGRRALVLPEYQRADRLHLVGLATVDPSARLVNGAHLIHPHLRRSEGYLTSACFSPTLDRYLALARLERGRQRMGEEELLAYDQGITTAVRVVRPTFYDPENLRLQG
jgi:sarcosine oxidase subunit alpha